jgi:hypothetical protein
MFHGNNRGLSNFIPESNGQLIDMNFHYLYNNAGLMSPLVAGAGIAITHVATDGDDSGYIFISNTFSKTEIC